MIDSLATAWFFLGKMKAILFALFIGLLLSGCNGIPGGHKPHGGDASDLSFSDDFPRKGFVHKVKKGETVRSIAKKFNSKVEWIMNANLIVEPTRVSEGTDLFVPIPPNP